MTQPKTISPTAAAAHLENGALLVDIREAAERQAGVIPNAAHAPLSALQAGEIPAAPDAYFLDGGIDAWRSQGLPVTQSE
jgi:rhodanese-related sulfurtransferase